VAGQGVGALLASWQQTETHWLPVTTTVAVLVSVAPDPLSVPAAAPPSFCVTPNQGSGPIWNEEFGAGVATMVAVLPTGTDEVTDAPVDAVPPLMVTEHHERKFMTVSVTLPPSLVPPSGTLASVAPSMGGAPVSAPLELSVPLEPSIPPLELPVSSGVEASDGDDAGVDELLQAAAVTTSAPMLAMPSQPERPIVMFITKPPRQRVLRNPQTEKG
jgi:hypothetical protein